MGNLSAAQSFLNQAISIRKTLGDETGVAYSQHNLQMIAPVAGPKSRSGSLRPWLVGGILAVVVGAFLFFSNSQKNQIQPESTTTPVIVATETKLIVTSSATLTPTNTDTPTPSPSPSVTATATPFPTDTITPTPTYTNLHGLSVNYYPTACRHGPGDPYLDKGLTLKTGNLMDVFGRAEVNGNSTWLLVDFSPPYQLKNGRCWMNAKYLNVSEAEVMSVAPTDPEIVLPVRDYYPDPSRSSPKLVSVVRNDANKVKVDWSFYDVTLADRESPTSARYLIEAWVCKAGKIIFQPIGVYFPQSGPYDPIASYIIEDEPGCTEPSHARLYLSWIDAYAGPLEIAPWP
jgi:hypothetical protein